MSGAALISLERHQRVWRVERHHGERATHLLACVLRLALDLLQPPPQLVRPGLRAFPLLCLAHRLPFLLVQGFSQDRNLWQHCALEARERDARVARLIVREGTAQSLGVVVSAVQTQNRA